LAWAHGCGTAISPFQALQYLALAFRHRWVVGIRQARRGARYGRCGPVVVQAGGRQFSCDCGHMPRLMPKRHAGVFAVGAMQLGGCKTRCLARLSSAVMSFVVPHVDDCFHGVFTGAESHNPLLTLRRCLAAASAGGEDAVHSNDESTSAPSSARVAFGGSRGFGPAHIHCVFTQGYGAAKRPCTESNSNRCALVSQRARSFVCHHLQIIVATPQSIARKDVTTDAPKPLIANLVARRRPPEFDSAKHRAL